MLVLNFVIVLTWRLLLGHFWHTNVHQLFPPLKARTHPETRNTRIPSSNTTQQQQLQQQQQQLQQQQQQQQQQQHLT